MILADTNYFIALAFPGDQLHSRAVAWTIQLNEPVLVSEYVMFEVMNGLSRAVLRSRAVAFANQIASDPLFVFAAADKNIFDRAMTLYRTRADKDWSLTDCSSFELMRERKITRALTLDHHFVQAGFEPLLRRNP